MDEKAERNLQKELLQKYLEGKCSQEEEQQVLRWFYSFDEKDESNTIQHNNLASEMNQRLEKVLFSNPKIFYIKRLAIAASILAVCGLGIGTYINLNNSKNKVQLAMISDHMTKYKGKDILPGSSFARITKNGTEISTHQDSTFYEATNIQANQSADLSIEVPKAGMYKIVLEDGTKVWLNSETKLDFPKVFAKNERRVSLSGEAYFDVAKEHNRPFRIQANSSQIEVLGTEFNVNTYQKEVKVSLIEGSVKITNDQLVKLLKPGQEASISPNEIEIKPKDVQLALAWKRSEINFEKATLEEILGQIGRWYDVEIEYKTKMADEMRYTGSISRQNNLSKVLEILEAGSSRKFEINGRKLLVY